MEIQYSNYVISQLGGEWTERIPPPNAVVINSWISLTFGISRLLCSKRLTQKRNLFSFSMVIAMTRRFLVKKIVCVNKDQINYKSLTWLQHKIPYNSFYHLRIFFTLLLLDQFLMWKKARLNRQAIKNRPNLNIPIISLSSTSSDKFI